MSMGKQRKYCKEKGLPMFAPESGYCYSCKRKITDTDEEHITGCPHCNKSFCE